MGAFHTYNIVSLQRNFLPQISQSNKSEAMLCLHFMLHFAKKGAISTYWRNTSAGCHFISLPLWVSALTTGMLISKHPCEATNNGIWETRTVFPRLPSLWTTVRRCSQEKQEALWSNAFGSCCVCASSVTTYIYILEASCRQACSQNTNLA